jgi:hypothetical protein
MYLRAFEHEGYWTIKIAFDEYDIQGTADDVLTLRSVSRVPSTDDTLDQAWLILLTAVKYLEQQGALGRVGGADWPTLC